MNKFFYSKSFCTVLSLILCVCLMGTALGLVSVFALRSEKIVQNSISSRSDELKADLKERLMLEMPDADEGMIEASLGSDTMDFIVSSSTKSIVIHNKIDFSSSRQLYNSIYKALASYGLSSEELGNTASLEVDIINGYMQTANSVNTDVFATLGSTAFFAVIGVFVAVGAACVFLVDLITKGRHNKYNYIGLGFTCAGLSGVSTMLAADKKGFFSGDFYCDLPVFNAAAGTVLSQTEKAFLIVSAVFFAIGAALLIYNYFYFTKKNKRVKKQRESVTKMREEYMQNYNEKNTPYQPPAAGEREVMDIDF